MEPLDPRAALAANEKLWANNPELARRQLTMGPKDSEYRKEWMRYYQEAAAETAEPPSPEIEPEPIEEPPPPVSSDEPVQQCNAVASMTHEAKMEHAIKTASDKGLMDDFKDELPSIGELIAGIIVVGGVLVGLGAAAAAVASTGVGAVIEGIAAAIVILLAALGIWTSSVQIKDGIVTLLEFFDATRCDKAQTPEDLDEAGEAFADGVAKVGVGTIMMILSVLGGRKGVKMGKGAKGRWQASKKLPTIGKKVSQKQLRHVKGRKEWTDRGRGSYMNSAEDAQQVLNAVHNGEATVLGTTRQGHLLVRYNGVTGYNNNPAAGYTNQPTNVFLIKGSKSPSVVPTSPSAVPAN